MTAEREEVGHATASFPNKKYSVIYADPPWHYSRSLVDKYGHTTGNVRWHYSTMTQKELSRLPVEELADTNCLLFLWVVSPKLDDGIDLGVAWGFRYITVGFIWDKQLCLPSNYTTSTCELVLIFKKGKIPQPRGIRNARQFLSEKRTRHSVKPDTIRQRIFDMFPTQEKIELFARQNCEGWDCWGNENDTQQDRLFDVDA